MIGGPLRLLTLDLDVGEQKSFTPTKKNHSSLKIRIEKAMYCYERFPFNPTHM